MSRRPLRTALTVLAAATGLLLAGIAPATAGPSQDALALGPNVVRTNDGPTGYEVTFRYDAPDEVSSVQIIGEWQFSDPSVVVSLTTPQGRWGADWRPGDILAPLAQGWLAAEMTQGEDGVWTWTSPLPSGTHSYSFMHDCTHPAGTGCARIIDPANPGWASALSPTGSQTLSQVYVPGHPRFLTDDNDYQAPTSPARTGTLEHRQYVSPQSTNPVGTHAITVYTPAGYDPNRATPYPTLYLSHGQGGNEADWSTQGAAAYVLENAIADGRAQPTVLVMTNFNGLAGDAGYASDLINNVIPFMEASYNVSADPADRAFGGLSLGGARGLGLLYNQTATFEYYGLWSAASFGATNLTPAQVERVRNVNGEIHIGTGLQDFVGNIGRLSVARVATLRSLGIEVTEYNIDGMHTWDVWRNMLNDYVRNVAFRTTTTEVLADNRGPHATVAAKVAPLGSSAASPSGKVEFSKDGVLLGTAPITKDGVARLNASYKGGAEGVEARYVGDSLFNSSTSD